MKKCHVCGKEINEVDVYCPHCGQKLIDEVQTNKETKEIPLKKRSVTLMLAFFLGAFGFEDLYMHRLTAFYLKFGLAFISMGLLVIPLMIIGFIHFLIILFNKEYKDGLGRKLI
ncbi:MAG: zinc-ribbon domain-containing protein [Bacilli bacterium]|nr:zinc-ribbon domain-containing protein [Bacilli bacterium]